MKGRDSSWPGGVTPEEDKDAVTILKRELSQIHGYFPRGQALLVDLNRSLTNS